MNGKIEEVQTIDYKHTRNSILNEILFALGASSFESREEIISFMRPILMKISVKLNRIKTGREVYYDNQSAALIIYELRKALMQNPSGSVREKILIRFPDMKNESLWESIVVNLKIFEEYGTFSIEI